MILILSHPGDFHATRLAATLNGRGVPAMALRSTLLPSGVASHVSYTPRGLEAELFRACGERVDLAAVEAVCDRLGDEPGPFVRDLRAALDCTWIVHDAARPADQATCDRLLACATEACGAVASARAWPRGA